MISSNQNPPMTREEVRRFRNEMTRRMRGDFTPRERENIIKAKNNYNEIIRRNGGKNPILGF